MKAVFAALLIVSFAALADDTSCIKDQSGNVVCGKGECVADQYKNIFCAPHGGSAVKDKYGTALCGVGQCAKDYLGQIWCSKELGGGAAVDDHNLVKCAGGCELAAAARCEAGK
jgi:hypothetical protein